MKTSLLIFSLLTVFGMARTVSALPACTPMDIAWDVPCDPSATDLAHAQTNLDLAVSLDQCTTMDLAWDIPCDNNASIALFADSTSNNVDLQDCTPMDLAWDIPCNTNPDNLLVLKKALSKYKKTSLSNGQDLPMCTPMDLAWDVPCQD